MVDVVDGPTRSRMMRGISGKNTFPELMVRSYLHAHGFRFRLHNRKLPGSPDIVLPKYRLCIFIHGCFWHRHQGCSYSTNPATRAEFWQEKFRGNVARDKRNIGDLQIGGWRVFVIWECGMRRKLDLKWLPSKVKGKLRYFEWPSPR